MCFRERTGWRHWKKWVCRIPRDFRTPPSSRLRRKPPPPSMRLEALENFIRGLTGSQDEERLRLLREAARLEPAWDRPAFELGQIYFMKRDCDSALVWY